jgi:hypothetical protein
MTSLVSRNFDELEISFFFDHISDLCPNFSPVLNRGQIVSFGNLTDMSLLEALLILDLKSAVVTETK